MNMCSASGGHTHCQGGRGRGGWRVCVCRWGGGEGEALKGGHNKVEPKYPGIPTPRVRISVLKTRN